MGARSRRAPDSYGWEFALPGRDWAVPASDPGQIATRTTWGKLRAGLIG